MDKSKEGPEQDSIQSSGNFSLKLLVFESSSSFFKSSFSTSEEFNYEINIDEEKSDSIKLRTFSDTKGLVTSQVSCLALLEKEKSEDFLHTNMGLQISSNPFIQSCE